MFVQFGEKLRLKISDPNNLNSTFLDSTKRKNIAMNRKKQTFLVFVKFCEKLRSKRFDQNHLKNTLFGLVRALKDCYESKNIIS